MAKTFNGSDAWDLAALLELYGVAWGRWNDLLMKWDGNRGVASEQVVYGMAAVTDAMAAGDQR